MAWPQPTGVWSFISQTLVSKMKNTFANCLQNLHINSRYQLWCDLFSLSTAGSRYNMVQWNMKIKPKNDMMYQDIYNCICIIQKNEDILSIMSNLQRNCCLKINFQKLDQHAGGQWLIQDTKRHKNNQLQSLKLPYRISKLSSSIWH